MQMLLALLDEANTGLTIGDGGDDSESEDNKYRRNSRSSALELLKDENDGLSVCLLSQFLLFSEVSIKNYSV